MPLAGEGHSGIHNLPSEAPFKYGDRRLLSKQEFHQSQRVMALKKSDLDVYEFLTNIGDIIQKERDQLIQRLIEEFKEKNGEDKSPEEDELEFPSEPIYSIWVLSKKNSVHKRLLALFKNERNRNEIGKGLGLAFSLHTHENIDVFVGAFNAYGAEAGFLFYLKYVEEAGIVKEE